MDPPTAASTPTKTAATSGRPRASALVVPMAPNNPIVRASSTVMKRLRRRKDAFEQHAEQRCAGGDHDVPVRLQGSEWHVEQQVAQETATEPDDDADDRDAEPVESAVAKLRGEKRTLQCADADREQVDPQGDHEYVVHVPILSVDAVPHVIASWARLIRCSCHSYPKCYNLF